jgi:hypothetical protein
MQDSNRYLRLLQDSDLRLLSAAAEGAAYGPDRLRGDPMAVDALLRGDRLFDSLFRSQERDPLLVASPFLVFWVLVHRVARDLERSQFVQEWLGPGRSVPVFDAASLKEFLAESRRRAFLAQLLASYTRVASGSIWERTARGWNRRRYSDLDPVRLAELAEVVVGDQRSAVLRRLGDLALFLSGVFPEYVASNPLQSREVERLRRLLNAARPEEVIRVASPEKGLWLLDWLGRSAYRASAEEADRGVQELAAVAHAFNRARRVLNVLTGRYLYPARERWFPGAGG